MIPTIEQFNKIKLYLLPSIWSQIKSQSDKEILNNFYVFEIDICDTNIDEKYECLSEAAIFKLRQILLGTIENKKIKATIFDTRIEERDNGILHLIGSFYIFRDTDGKKRIKDIENSQISLDFSLHIENSRCPICDTHIKGRGSCPYHKQGKINIYTKKLGYIITENPTILNWKIKQRKDNIEYD